MAKKAPAPTCIVLRLNAPGMSSMHRAGLGGLAAALQKLDRRRKLGELSTKAPWHNEFSWEVTPTEITLNWDKPEWAKDFFEWLFKESFKIEEGIIYLPGQNNENSPLPLEVRTQLQNGLMLTFLQHGQTRKTGKEEEKSYEFDSKVIKFLYKECLSYVHQKAWNDWINNKGELVLKNYDVQGPINPGAVVRHNAFATPTKVSQPLELVLPLIFAIVGTLAYPINRALGVLIVPYVKNLQEFAKLRPRITPNKITNSFVASAGDAVLQFEIQCEGSKLNRQTKTNGCDAILFRPMPWSTQQKSRSEVLSVTSVDHRFYSRVLEHFPSRVIDKVTEKKNGRGKDAIVIQETEHFWVQSVVRPFIADNIVRHKYWFAGFTQLMNSTDPVSGRPMREKIQFERGGLNKMVSDKNLDWKIDGGRSLVLAVHEALRCRYGQIGSERGLSDTGTKNRLENEYERWRLAFAGAKTPEQFRFALSDLFSRAKSVPELKKEWEKIVKLLQIDWQSARDLALIGLASYKGKESGNTEENTENKEE